jgi:hypothetical protein
MECVWIVFTVIGFGIWILVTLFRKAEEERQRNQQRQAGNRAPGRRPVTDLDRFLEEARRRKEAQGRPAADAPWAQPVDRPPPRPARAVQPAPAARPLERRREFTPSVRRSASEQRAQVPMARPTVTTGGRQQTEVMKPAPVVLELVDDDAAPALGLPADMQAPPPPMAALGGVLARPATKLSPVLTHLPTLLKQPETIAAVFALREIFGPPLCRKYMLPTNAVTPRS